MQVFSRLHLHSRIIAALSLVLVLTVAFMFVLSLHSATHAAVNNPTVSLSSSASYTLRTVTYCMGFKMDIYTPTGTNHPVPAVEYVHGGGWSQGSRTAISPQESIDTIHNLLGQGFIVTSIDYQLITSVNPGFPDNIKDVACSVRFLRGNANQYQIDPNHIGLFGDSAGGQLASLAGLADETDGFDNGVYPGVSSKVEAVEDLFGPTTSAASKFRTSQANPITWVSQTQTSDPPFLILQGDQDTIVLPQESQDLDNALIVAGQPAILQMVQNAQHEFVPSPPGATLSPSPSQIDAMMLNFFIQQL